MGIGINSIGNYGFYSNKINRPTANRAINNVNEIKKTENISRPKEKSVISENEKKFFSERYPEQKQIIMDYHFYQRTGKMAGVSVGSIINRRG